MKSDPNALKEELKEVCLAYLIASVPSDGLSLTDQRGRCPSTQPSGALVASLQVLDLEEEGKSNMTVRLKKRALQGAYDQAIKKKKVCAYALLW